MSKWANSQPCFRFLAFFLFFILFLSTSLTLSFSFSPPTLSEIFVKYLTASTNYCWCDRWKFISWFKYSIKKHFNVYLSNNKIIKGFSQCIISACDSFEIMLWMKSIFCLQEDLELSRQATEKYQEFVEDKSATNSSFLSKRNPPQIHPFLLKRKSQQIRPFCLR